MKPIRVTLECADCEATATVDWPTDRYHSTLEDDVTLDGTLHLPTGWWAVPGSVGGDNVLRCPLHSRAPVLDSGRGK